MKQRPSVNKGNMTLMTAMLSMSASVLGTEYVEDQLPELFGKKKEQE